MYFNNELIEVLKKSLAKEKIFLVGGAVRDLLMHSSTKHDYDFLLEGDVFTYCEKVSESLQFPIKINKNKHLLTVNFQTPWGIVDFARARKEVYPFSGALPKVAPINWQEDIKRRDFTINTLVIPLYSDGWGNIIDLLNGKRDISSKTIRTLHESSFKDDPTRILRAIRFKNRLNFTIERETFKYLQLAWRYISNVSPARRFKEWILLCDEEAISASVKDIYEMGGWPYYLKGINSTSDTIALTINEIENLPQKQLPDKIRRWYIVLLIILINNYGKAEELFEYLGLYKKDRRGLLDTLAFLKQKAEKSGLEEFKNINSLPLEGIYYFYLKYYSHKENWWEFNNRIKRIKMPISGDDLIEYGVKPGPYLGSLLKRLEDSFWRGEYNNKADGLELMQKILKGG